MVGSGTGLAEVETIAAVDGVDLVLVGSQHLTYALGIPGQADSPAVLEACTRVAAACAPAGTTFGVAGVSDTGTLARYVSLGARFATVGSDTGVLREAATRRVTKLRALTPGTP